MAVSPVSDVTELSIQVPFKNLYKDLFLGRIPAVDFTAPAPWFVGLASSLDMYGLELAQASGLIFPGDVVLEGGISSTGAQYLLEQGEITTGTITEGSIFVDDVVRDLEDASQRTNWEKIQGGGILVDGRLTLPRFITEPVDLFTEIYDQLREELGVIAEDCTDTIQCVMAHPEETFAFLRGLLNIPGQLTALQQVAQLQLFVPDLFTPILDELGGIETLVGLQPDQLWEQISSTAAQLQQTISDLWLRDGYLYGQYGNVTVDGNPEATTSKLLGVEMGEAIIRGRGSRLEIIGDFLGLETHFFVDVNPDATEAYSELNGTTQYDLAEPFAAEPFEDLPDADGNRNGIWDPAESFDDVNDNGVWDSGEPFEDVNGNGTWDPAEPFEDWNRDGTWSTDGGDLDGDGQWDRAETWTDLNGNGVVDDREYQDLNKNGRYDSGDPWRDLNGNGVVDYFEYSDINPRNGRYDPPEPWEDRNGNGLVDEREWVELNGPPPGLDHLIFEADGDIFVDLNNDGVRQVISDEIVQTATDDGDLEFDSGLPRIAAEVILGTAPQGCSFELPNTYTVKNAQLQFQDFLAAVGLGDVGVGNWLQLGALNGGACLRAYSPGYSYDPTAPEIKRRGGIEMIADLSLSNFIDDAHFEFDVALPESGLIPNFTAKASASEINLGTFLLPGLPPDGATVGGIDLELSHQSGVVSFGIGGTFSLLGQAFTLPRQYATFAPPVQEREGNGDDYFFQADADGIFGRLQLTPPSAKNHPLLTGPIQLDGTYALVFDTRGSQPSLSIEVTDGRLSILGYELAGASFTLMVSASGAVTLSNVSADSPLFGPAGTGLVFNNSITLLPPLPGTSQLRLGAGGTCGSQQCSSRRGSIPGDCGIARECLDHRRQHRVLRRVLRFRHHPRAAKRFADGQYRRPRVCGRRI